MRKYKKLSDDGQLIAIGTGAGGEEITEAEYSALLSEIREKIALVNQLYGGEIAAEDVPAEWREEIQRRVNERIEREVAAEDDISDEKFVDMLEEVL